MARNFNGTSDFIEATSAVVSGYPFTIACWFRLGVLGIGQRLIFMSDASDFDRFHGLHMGPDNLVKAVSRNDATGVSADSTTAASVSTWYHGAAVFTSATSRAVFLNGGSKGTNTESATWNAAIDTTSIGRVARTSIPGNFNGYLAEAAIWNVSLSDDEIAILGLGYSPRCLTHRLGNLVMYQDLIRPLDRPGIGPSMTATGTTVSNHVPIIYPSGLHQGLPPITPKVGGPFCIETANVWTPTVVAGQDFFVGVQQGESVSTGPAAGEVNC